MNKLSSYFVFPLLALVILIFALSSQMFNAPPLGKLLDPFIGAVQNEDEGNLAAPQVIFDKKDLVDSVHVFFDNRKVPHIYASNTEDLYFAQGYVTASLRLWQMDFLTYAAPGRLSEIFSFEWVFNYDRVKRRIGILDAAKATLKMIEADPETNKVLTAYTKGVNAYISKLNYKAMPFEYKLLNYQPEPWTNLKTVLIMKYMSNILSGYEEDASMTNMILALGEDNFNKFFPDFNSRISPVMPNASEKLNTSLTHIAKPSYLDYSFVTSSSVLSKSTYNPKLGSNSWVVSGKKTKSGFPILCSDPHLGLSLPSIWIEMQLSSPEMNVYGVSIPGTPAVIIGFNENIAWGITNGADDVKDWYKLKISEDYKTYELDGKWQKLTYSIEEVKRKGQLPFYDTIYHSVHGPIVITKNFPNDQEELMNYALKWELHNPSNEFLTFIQLNKAKNYEDYKDAIKHYSCPIQNFTFASKDNTIAVNHQGNMAVKSQGQGKFILDGTKSSFLSTKYIPADSLPQLFNPSCNYVLSANQHPTYAGYPYYYNGYYSETRANRIQQLLEKENGFDIQKMKTMQLDNTNSFAADAMPVLINTIDKNKLTEEGKMNLETLNTWKGTYDRNDESAEFFELWWRNIEEYTWDEFKKFNFHSRSPEDYVLLNLIEKEPSNDYFDKQGTSVKESAPDIVFQAFEVASTDYKNRKAEGRIAWKDCNKVDVMHMTNMEAFSRMEIPSSGHPESINATSKDWGPSWRMIVELGPRPKAFGVYAGGQSGNVGSRYYDNFIDDWNKGNYYPLTFYMSMKEAKEQTSNTWILK